MRLLLIEDSPRLRKNLATALTRLGHAVDAAVDGQEGDEFRRVNDYEAIILDRMLPDTDGATLLKRWREEHGVRTPVLLLTALHSVPDRVQGLACGADDYLPKPFSVDELLARLEAIVRRSYGQTNSTVRLGALEIDLAARKVTRDGETVSLTARDFALLECLARRPGQVLNRQQIEEALYGEASSPLSNAVDSAVYSLRRKLSPGGSPSYIQTRRGMGYVLETPK